jgi:hypothetical protein
MPTDLKLILHPSHWLKLDFSLTVSWLLFSNILQLMLKVLFIHSCLMLQDGQRRAFAATVMALWLNGSHYINCSTNTDIGSRIAFT